MSDALNLVYQTIDEENRRLPAATRRQLVAGAAATVGGLGLLGLPGLAKAHHPPDNNTVQNILNIAATAEVLATIVNTVGPERISLDPTTKANVEAAAREELIHYRVLTSPDFGGVPLATTIWIPDAVFADSNGLLSTLVVGDQIFINAYLIATTVFGDSGNGVLARYAAEFMGVEAVHRALARQSLGLLGNDRAFMKYDQRERADGPGNGMPGFTDITVAVQQLQAAGFGFGAPGASPGAFYEFRDVRRRTPNPAGVNTRRVA